MSQKDSIADSSSITMSSASPPELGEVVLRREIPSDEKLLTPTVVRVMDFLVEEDLVREASRNQVALCVEEALSNAIVHGNRGDFTKMTRFSVCVGDTKWSLQVEDEGEGFALEGVPCPLRDEALLEEGGRGLSLMAHYMNEVSFYLGGRILVLSRSLR